MSRYYTPGIPNGWFQIGYDTEVAAGQMLPLKYFGRELVLVRTASGKLAALEAHCGLCGAHFGFGGSVVDETIVCPKRHAFDAAGGHVGQPGVTPVRTWPLVTLAGLVIVWNHDQGLPPQWGLPDEVPEWGTKDGVRNEEWTDFEIRRWTIKTRNQEMAENAVDSVHFHYVHGTQNMPTSQAEVQGHILRVFSDTGMETPQGHVDGSVESLSFGFGVGTVRFRGIAETLLVSGVTPIDDEHVDVRFHFSVKKLGGRSITKGVGLAFVNEVSRQLEQDIPIWENKIQLERPMICEGDGPIGLFRRWSKQFYSPTDQAAELALGSAEHASCSRVVRS